MTTATMEIELRGAPWDLLKRLANYREQKRVLEILVEGPGGTGKSRGIGHILFWLAHEYPGIRILVCRKTRTSLSESFLQTWEDEVVPQGHAMLTGAHRSHREQYEFGNGSVLVLGGLDKPERLYSTQFDVVFVQEAIELSLDEWERFYRALRSWRGGIPFQLLLGDTNPDAPTHWLNQRCERGECERMQSLHKDNPKLHDGTNWTYEGLAYIGGLKRLSGVRRARLLDGRWVAAEGAVWETYSQDTHLIDRPEKLSDLGITWFVGAVDWGYQDPGVMQVWGITAKKRAYRVAEWYTTNALLEWWVEQIVGAAQKYRPMRRIVCDPSRPDAIAAVNLRLTKIGLMDTRCVGANNARHSAGSGDLVGLDLVRERLVSTWDDETDGEHDQSSSLYFLRDSSQCRDEWLIQNNQPTCTEQEIPGYVYVMDETGRASKERTDPSVPDHGCDATRYMANYIWRRDLSPREEPPKPVPGTRAGALLRRDPEAAAEWIAVENYKLRKGVN